MRIAIYARKSTESEDRQIQSLADQIKALTDLAQREGLKVSEVFQESKSAKDPGARTEFQRLVKEIQAGRINGVLTWSINRLSRNLIDGGLVAHMLQTGKLDFIKTIDRTYRPDDNALLLSIENGMATAYLQDLSRNVRRGMASKVAKGWLIGKAPIGYLNDLVTHEVVPDPERFHLVRSAWDMLLAGNMSVSEIHAELVRRGLTVFSYRRGRGPISRSHVHRIFSNRVYLGEIPYQGRQFPGAHRAMVSAEEFDAARRLIRSRDKRSAKARRGHAFSHVMTCGKCGCLIVGETKRKYYSTTKRTAKYVYYHCSGARGCQRTSIEEKALIRNVEAWAASVALPSALGAWAHRSLGIALERRGLSTAQSVSALTSRLEQLQRRLRELTNMRLDGELTREDYSCHKQEIESEIRSVEGDLRRADNANPLFLRAVKSSLDAAVRAGELSGRRRDVMALAAFLRAFTETTLRDGSLEIRAEPMLELIARFEPLKDLHKASESNESLFFPHQDRIWLALLDDLRTVFLTDKRYGEGGRWDPS